MKRHVFGTFLLGATVAWLVSYAVHLAGYTDLAFLVGAFFGTLAIAATVVDYLELKQRQEYDDQIPPRPEIIGAGVITYVGTSEEELPDEVREIIERFVANHDAPAAVVKVSKMETVHKVEPQLTKEELDEIEEKFS